MEGNRVKTNELKKGTRIRLANGWEATLVDNARGDIRTADVEGYFRETGSVYSHDIAFAQIDGQWVAVGHTPSQEKMRRKVADWEG